MKIPIDPEMQAAIDACAAATTTRECILANERMGALLARDRGGACTCDDAPEMTDAQILGFGTYISDRRVTHHPSCARIALEPHRFERAPELAELPWWTRLGWWARQPVGPEWRALPLRERLWRTADVVLRGKL